MDLLLFVRAGNPVVALVYATLRTQARHAKRDRSITSMIQLLDLIRRRRAIKHFDPDYSLDVTEHRLRFIAA